MNKYLLLDTGLLTAQGMDNVKLSVSKLEKDVTHHPFFTEDYFAEFPKKWEVRFDNGYPNVIYDPVYQIYRCYYTCCSYDPVAARMPLKERVGQTYEHRPGRITSLAYAESKDGIHWEKPELGLVEFEGSKANNLLFRFAHGTGVFLDEEETDRKKRYKLVTKVDYSHESSFMAVNFSEDGIHWGDMIPWPKYNPRADSHNFAFRDKRDGKFRILTRIWKNNKRITAMCESMDFINWSEPVEVLRGRGFQDQVYSMPVFQENGLYLGLPSVFHEGDRSAFNFDTVDCELAYASTPEQFDWVAPGDVVIKRGEGVYPGAFDCGCIYASAPVDAGDRLWIYYMGGNGCHTNYRESSLGRGYLWKEKYAFYESVNPEKVSILTTTTFQIYGEEFYILADVADGGRLETALCEKWNKPIPGYGFDDCEIEQKENGFFRIRFRGRMLMDLRPAPIMICFRFYRAKLYALHCEMSVQSQKY